MKLQRVIAVYLAAVYLHNCVFTLDIVLDMQRS